MKLYFAGLSNPDLITKETDILLSYLDKSAIKKVKQKIFLDSGAFSAFTQGKIIDIQEYSNYIIENKTQFETYAGLDVIGDYKKSRENIEYMESRNLNPLPTFHFGSPENELKRLLKKYPYIALGGLVPYSKKRNQLKSWLDYCFSIIGSKSKIHGFGINAYWAWERYPFYSVDATSWIQWSIYYHVNTVVPEDSSVKLYRRKAESNNKRAKLLIAYYLKKQKQITKLWEKRGIKWT